MDLARAPRRTARVRRALGTRMGSSLRMGFAKKNSVSHHPIRRVRCLRRRLPRSHGTVREEYPVNSTKTGTLTPMIKGAAVTMSGYFYQKCIIFKN